MILLRCKAKGSALVSLAVLALAQAAFAAGPQTSVASAPPSQAVHVEPPSPTATPEQLEARGDQLRGQKFYREAVDYYTAALKRREGEKSKVNKKSQAGLYNKIGLVEMELGNLKESRKNLERSIKVDKTLPEAHNNLGVVHYLQKKYRPAIKEYRKALALEEASASVHNNLATVYFAQKKFEQAAMEYQRALQLDPEIFERSSRTGVAARMSSPEDRATFDYVLARLFAKRGNLDQSLEYLRKAMEEGYKQISKVYEEDEFKELRKDPRFAELMASKPVAISN